MTSSAPTATAQLRELLEQRIVVLDGAWGTMLQRQGLTDADYRGERFRDHPRDIDVEEARRGAEAARALLERIGAGEEEGDRWQVEQRLRHAENKLAVAGR